MLQILDSLRVTYALYNIFKSEIDKDTIIKGGTALSKCFSLIERFWEDIDLIVVKREGESKSTLKNKLKIISEVVNALNDCFLYLNHLFLYYTNEIQSKEKINKFLIST